MSTFQKSSILGALLVIIGSFLPWRKEGDFISFWTPGIGIYPRWEDNGGLLPLVLSLAVLWFILQPPVFIKKPVGWNIAFGMFLLVDSCFHMGRLLHDYLPQRTAIGAPVIEIGLWMVLTGSLIALLAAMFQNQESSK
jgi:hypothetical protein